MRTSRRGDKSELDEGESSSMESDEWGVGDGDPAPINDPEWTRIDKQWRAACVKKPVFFRWSTAFNSKNKFKGLVTQHKSRKSTAFSGSKSQARIDFLVIKVFGSSEDRYMMGKDVRELYVLPNKTALMEPSSEEEIKAKAVRKWTAKEGWVENSCSLLDDSAVCTAAETPLITEVRKNHSRRIKAAKLVPRETKIATGSIPVSNEEMINTVVSGGVLVATKHGKRSMAARIAQFAFYN